MQQPLSLQELPFEVITCIVSHLANDHDFKALLNLRMVSKQMYLAASQDRVWLQVLQSFNHQHQLEADVEQDSFSNLCRIAQDQTSKAWQLPHVGSMVDAAWVYSLSSVGLCCSRCWQPTRNRVVVDLQVRLCNGCLKDCIVSATAAQLQTGLSQLELQGFVEDGQLRLTQDDVGSSTFYLLQELLLCQRDQFPSETARLAACQVQYRQHEERLNQAHAITIARELAFNAALTKYTLRIEELQQRHAHLDSQQLPRWALVYHRCLDFLAQRQAQSEQMLSLQAELLVVELASACHSSRKAHALQERLGDYSLPDYWVTPQDTIDVTAASIYPELVFFIMGDWVPDALIEARAVELLAGIAQEEQRRLVAVEAIRSKLIVVCQSNRKALLQARKSDLYRRIMSMRRPPEATAAVQRILQPVVASLRNTAASQDMRRNLVASVLGNQHVPVPSAEELTFFNAWGRPELHPLSNYQHFIDGEDGVTLEMAVAQWMSYAPSSARGRLLQLLEMVGVHWLISMLNYDFGDSAKLHLLRFIATTKSGACPFKHELEEGSANDSCLSDDEDRLDFEDDQSASPCEQHHLQEHLNDMDLQPDGLHEPAPSLPCPAEQDSPLISRAQSTQGSSVPRASSRLRNRSHSSPEALSGSCSPVPRRQEMSGALLRRRGSHAPSSFSSLSSSHIGTDSSNSSSTLSCHCESQAVHRVAIALIRWAARLNRLQACLPNRGLLHLKSAAARQMLVEISLQVFGTLPQVPIQDYQDVMSLKLKGFFNLNLELHDQASSVHKQWLRNLEQTFASSKDRAQALAARIEKLEQAYEHRTSMVRSCLQSHKLQLATGWENWFSMAEVGIRSGGLMALLAQYVHSMVKLTWPEVEDAIARTSKRRLVKRQRRDDVLQWSHFDISTLDTLPSDVQVAVDQYVITGQPSCKHAALSAQVGAAAEAHRLSQAVTRREKTLRNALISDLTWSQACSKYQDFVLALPELRAVLRSAAGWSLTTAVAEVTSVMQQHPPREETTAFCLSLTS